MKWVKPIALATAAWTVAIKAMCYIVPGLYGSVWMVPVSFPLAVYLSLIFTILFVLICRPLVGKGFTN